MPAGYCAFELWWSALRRLEVGSPGPCRLPEPLLAGTPAFLLASGFFCPLLPDRVDLGLGDRDAYLLAVAGRGLDREDPLLNLHIPCLIERDVQLGGIQPLNSDLGWYTTLPFPLGHSLSSLGCAVFCEQSPTTATIHRRLKLHQLERKHFTYY